MFNLLWLIFIAPMYMRHLLSRKEELGKTTAATIRTCFIVKILQFPLPGLLVPTGRNWPDRRHPILKLKSSFRIFFLLVASAGLYVRANVNEFTRMSFSPVMMTSHSSHFVGYIQFTPTQSRIQYQISVLQIKANFFYRNFSNFSPFFFFFNIFLRITE